MKRAIAISMFSIVALLAHGGVGEKVSAAPPAAKPTVMETSFGEGSGGGQYLDEFYPEVRHVSLTLYSYPGSDGQIRVGLAFGGSTMAYLLLESSPGLKTIEFDAQRWLIESSATDSSAAFNWSVTYPKP